MSGGSGKFYITGDIIYGPKDNGRFFIAGNYIYGPRNSGKYYLRGDNLYGPTSSAKWSLRDGYFPSSRSNRHRPISIYLQATSWPSGGRSGAQGNRLHRGAEPPMGHWVSTVHSEPIIIRARRRPAK